MPESVVHPTLIRQHRPAKRYRHLHRNKRGTLLCEKDLFAALATRLVDIAHIVISPFSPSTSAATPSDLWARPASNLWRPGRPQQSYANRPVAAAETPAPVLAYLGGDGAIRSVPRASRGHRNASRSHSQAPKDHCADSTRNWVAESPEPGTAAHNQPHAACGAKCCAAPATTTPTRGPAVAPTTGASCPYETS